MQRILKWILYIAFFLSPYILKAESNVVLITSEDYSISDNNRPPFKKLRKLQVKLSKAKQNRATAAGLAIILGPFGVHRLYLGTSTKVPIIYSITLGGFFILPIIDLGVILFTKDFDRLKEDERVIMWSPKKNLLKF